MASLWRFVALFSSCISLSVNCCCFFFFQAEDGIRDYKVTGVQTCALPIFITMLDPQQAFLVNRNKIGSMALAGESLFVLEMRPASYAILAANEAEKAARIKLVDYRMIGATGRLYLSGSEADVRQAAGAAEDALRNLG